MKIYKKETELINIEIGILQRLSILLIFFFFFVANLLDVTNNKALQILLFAFVDNTYILIYRNLTKYNYKTLKRIYREYKKQLKIHKAKFTLKKYKLIYFAKRLKDFNI